jgi:hypothetical protein
MTTTSLLLQVLLEDPLAVAELDANQLHAVRIFKHNEEDDVMVLSSPEKPTDSFFKRTNKKSNW